MTDEGAKGLMATTDGMIWAQEFCRIFDGGTVVAGDLREARYATAKSPFLDEGTMVAWFANAIEVGRSAGMRGDDHDGPEVDNAAMQQHDIDLMLSHLAEIDPSFTIGRQDPAIGFPSDIPPGYWVSVGDQTFIAPSLSAALMEAYNANPF